MVVLATPDVTVTNESDKTTQIERLKIFAANVQKVNTGGFKLVMTIERAVGPKPKGRTWRDEWVDAFVERGRITGETFSRSTFESGGAGSPENYVKNLHDGITWKVNTGGWPRDQAEAFEVITGCLKAPISAAVRDRSGRYAASTHLVCECLAQRARQMTKVAPPIYYNLTGFFGLATDDPAWEVLTKPDAKPGLGFVSNGVVGGPQADSRYFPNDQGFHVYLVRGGAACFELQDSDVVMITSRSKDEDGYHSLVQTVALGYQMPPLTTVTLEKVQQPGEWEVCGQRPKRKLYTVSVTYKEERSIV